MSAVPSPVPPARPVISGFDLPEQAELALEVMRLRDQVFGLRAENAEMAARLAEALERNDLRSNLDPDTVVEHLELVVHDLEFQLRQVKESTTWRLGRALLRPVSWIRRQKSS